MKSSYQRFVAAALSAFVLACCAALFLGHKVSAAGEGKITGTVKLTGNAPHMKGIDMSKDPYCVKANSTPAHLENVVVGSGGGLENVVLYISEGLPASAQSETPTTVPVFNQKNCVYTPHVLALDVNQKFKVVTSDQTTHNIHPNPNPMTGNIPWNQSQPPGAQPVEKSWKSSRIHPGAVQHPSLDARLVRSGERTVCHHRREWLIHDQQRPTWKLHGDGVAGRSRNPDCEGDCSRRSIGHCGLYLQSEVIAETFTRGAAA